jgi:transmembrane sensor
MGIHLRTNELFTKYMDGSCSPAEWEELLVLVMGIRETDTEMLSEPLLQLWEQARRKELPSSVHLVDREKLFATITGTPRIGFRQLAAAAIIGVLLMAAGMLYLVRSNEAAPVPDPVMAQAEKVRPGVDKAVLVLGDGKRILLDSSARGVLSRQGNTTLINFSGKLAYQPHSGKGGRTGQAVAYNSVVTARANQYQLVLPDGTTVWLNAVSSIRFPTAFTGPDRTVEITGEAYFEVAKDVSKPFVVKAGGIKVAVLGTRFNINAYPDEAAVTTSLVEGSVRVTSADRTGLLTPGQEASLPANGELTIGAGNVALAVAWKDGYFQFDRASLPEVLRQIGRWYDLAIQYPEKVRDRWFKGKIQRSLPLSGVLNLLKKGGVGFSIEGKTLTVLE